MLTLKKKSKLALDQRLGPRYPLVSAVSVAARVEEVSVMADDYLTDRKAFCLRGYLAAGRGDDVNAGGQKGHFTGTVYNCCSFPADTPTTKERLIQSDANIPTYT